MPLEGGLPSVDDIARPSVMLLELAHSRSGLAAEMTLARLLQVWRAVGRCIAATLLRGKGVVVHGLGTFAFDTRGRPAFTLQTKGVRGVRWHGLRAQRCVSAQV